MVDVLGHVAMGLLWAAPAWFYWERRVNFAFVGSVLLAVLVPDVDLYIPWVVHHGITHTVLFVAIVSLVGGAVSTTAGTRTLRRRWRQDDDRAIAWPSRSALVAGGLLVGGLSHVFVDMLSTSAAERPIEPFWPFFENPFDLYLIHHYSAPIWNGGLLLVALSIHLALFVLDDADPPPSRR